MEENPNVLQSKVNQLIIQQFEGKVKHRDGNLCTDVGNLVRTPMIYFGEDRLTNVVIAG